jgi:hypothetical protein
MMTPFQLQQVQLFNKVGLMTPGLMNNLHNVMFAQPMGQFNNQLNGGLLSNNLMNGGLQNNQFNQQYPMGMMSNLQNGQMGQFNNPLALQNQMNQLNNPLAFQNSLMNNQQLNLQNTGLMNNYQGLNSFQNSGLNQLNYPNSMNSMNNYYPRFRGLSGSDMVVNNVISRLPFANNFSKTMPYSLAARTESNTGEDVLPGELMFQELAKGAPETRESKLKHPEKNVNEIDKNNL